MSIKECMDDCIESIYTSTKSLALAYKSWNLGDSLVISTRLLVAIMDKSVCGRQKKSGQEREDPYISSISQQSHTPFRIINRVDMPPKSGIKHGRS